eukprot:354287-Chlamydomonas_euryale.AAC.9
MARDAGGGLLPPIDSRAAGEPNAASQYGHGRAHTGMGTAVHTRMFAVGACRERGPRGGSIAISLSSCAWRVSGTPSAT